jgi:hypothetical protein
LARRRDIHGGRLRRLTAALHTDGMVAALVAAASPSLLGAPAALGVTGAAPHPARRARRSLSVFAEVRGIAARSDCCFTRARRYQKTLNGARTVSLEAV